MFAEGLTVANAHFHSARPLRVEWVGLSLFGGRHGTERYRWPMAPPSNGQPDTLAIVLVARDLLVLEQHRAKRPMDPPCNGVE